MTQRHPATAPLRRRLFTTSPHHHPRAAGRTLPSWCAVAAGMGRGRSGLTLPRGAQSVTLHTTVGDIKIELYCDRVRRATFVRGGAACRVQRLALVVTPGAASRVPQNFLALAANGKYDGTVFHR